MLQTFGQVMSILCQVVFIHGGDLPSARLTMRKVESHVLNENSQS